jgi:drug/metabolite transporter (DMT)-like permease
MTTTHSQKAGYVFALLAFTIFATQDAISKHLADHYPPPMITMIRYWVFAGFALVITSRSKAGLRAGSATRRPWLQFFRGVLLALQVAVTMIAFRVAGLVHSQVLFAASPLLVAILSVPILGETVGWRRWTAIIIGMLGVLLILKPQASGFDIGLVVPLIGASMSAVYSIATRLASRTDTAATSFLYTGIGGAVVMSLIGPFYWTELAPTDWAFVGIVCVTGFTSHFCLIKAYDHLDAVLVQPFNYFQLVLASFYGIVIFGETLTWNVVVGSAIIIAASLFTIWREAKVRKRTATDATAT